MQLVMHPEKFDIIVTENLYGDVLSDLVSGLIGGLGLLPSSNLGKDFAMFEAVHGSALILQDRDCKPNCVLMVCMYAVRAYRKARRCCQDPQGSRSGAGGREVFLHQISAELLQPLNMRRLLLHICKQKRCVALLEFPPANTGGFLLT